MRRPLLALACLALATTPARADDAQEELIDRIDGVMGSLPGADGLIGKQVVVGEVPAEAGWYGLRKLRMPALRRAFLSALNRRGIHYQFDAPIALTDPFAAPGLLRSHTAATAAMVLQCDVDGDEGALTISLFTGKGGGVGIKDQIPGSYGLVVWDKTRAAIYGGGALAALLLLFGLGRWRAHRAHRAASVLPGLGGHGVATGRGRPPNSPITIIEGGAARGAYDDGIALSEDALKLLYDPGPPAGVHDLAAPRPGAATVALGDGDLVEIGDPSRAATAAVAPSRPSGTKVVLGTAETITLPKAGPPFVDRDERPEPATPTPSSSTSLLVAALPEKILGRYRVVAELGRGAMGVVLRAHDENLERDVAIKALTQTVRAYPDAIRLFASEAKALAHLNHPNIVAIYDQAVERSEAYLIMELVEGQTLEKLLHQRGPIPPPIALGLIDQLCAGLAYAHGKSVIHRDIKPANIFVTRDGTVKLGDFGLARVMHEVSIRQTEVRGTPLYMSPEQVVGEDIDHRADLYAVGCTLFELLTGKPPFAEGQVLFLHLTAEPPPPSTLRAELPPAIDELVLALLQKVAGDRPPNAADVRRRIAAILPTLPKAG